MAKSSILRDRVYTALSFREPDICPYYIWIDPEMMAPLGSHYRDPDFRDNYIRDHTVMTEILALKEPVPGGLSRDDFGAVRRQGNIPHLEKPALSGPSLAGYQFPDLTTDEHFNHLDAWLDRCADRFKIVQLGELFFERSWLMRGFENILTDFLENPGFAAELMDNLAETCIRVVDRLVRDYGERIDAIGLSNDSGAEKSMLISPETWRKFVKPGLARICERIRRSGRKTYLHSCGHVTPIIPDLIEIGVEMLQPIQPESMDIFRLKKEFGRDICLVGGISTQRTLPFGTPDDVVREVRKCLEVMAVGGGYILAPAKPILPGVPLDNAVALIDAIVRQEKH